MWGSEFRVTSQPKRLRAAGALWQGTLVSRLESSSGADAGVVGVNSNALQVYRGVCVASAYDSSHVGSKKRLASISMT